MNGDWTEDRDALIKLWVLYTRMRCGLEPASSGELLDARERTMVAQADFAKKYGADAARSVADLAQDIGRTGGAL